MRINQREYRPLVQHDCATLLFEENPRNDEALHSFCPTLPCLSSVQLKIDINIDINIHLPDSMHLQESERIVRHHTLLCCSVRLLVWLLVG